MAETTIAAVTAGRAVGDDEPIGIRVGHDLINVYVDLGSTLRWFALSPRETRVLCEHMLRHADELEAGR